MPEGYTVVDVGHIAAYSGVTAQAGWLGLKIGAVLHLSDEPGVLSKCLEL